MPEIVIKPGREKSILRMHPWIFSGAVETINGTPEPGEVVDVVTSDGRFLARAACNTRSKIVGRIWTWEPAEQVDEHFLQTRILRAISIRTALQDEIRSDAIRLVHGESDGLPGLIVDKYADVIVLQFLTAGIEYWRETIVDLLNNIIHPASLYERSDVDVRQLEGLEPRTGLIKGDSIRDPITIVENEHKFLVDILAGHKTGFYLDQRANRLIARRVSDGRKILDCFSYTGGFAVNCLAGGANTVTLVDSSSVALEQAHKNIKLNVLDLNKVSFVDQDVFIYLRLLRDKDEHFDVVILDPPKFAPTAAQAERAARGYKDINLLALKLLDVSGYLLTFSCSGGVNEDLFQKIVADAALDAGVNAVILKRLHQDSDHPVALNFPEGAYLKGFLIQKVA